MAAPTSPVVPSSRAAGGDAQPTLLTHEDAKRGAAAAPPRSLLKANAAVSADREAQTAEDGAGSEDDDILSPLAQTSSGNDGMKLQERRFRRKSTVTWNFADITEATFSVDASQKLRLQTRG